MFINDRKTMYILLAILLFLTISSLASFNLVITLLTLPGVILAISFHEFAHAFAADRLGDPTPRNQGRLSIDPMKHIDPVGIFLLIFAHIGWGKPVEINTRNFSKVSPTKGEIIVSLAGPLMNFFLAFVLMIIFYAILVFVPNSGILMLLSQANFVSIAMTMLYYAAIVNIGLGVFNLIPIPPLDGSKIFLHILPYKTKMWINENMMTIQLVFMALFFFGVLSYITSPIITLIIDGMQYLIGLIFSIFI